MQKNLRSQSLQRKSLRQKNRAPRLMQRPQPLEPVPVTDELIAAFTKGTCNACHIIPDIPGAVGMVGPDLTNIGVDARDADRRHVGR